jgi:hypothetical protein
MIMHKHLICASTLLFALGCAPLWAQQPREQPKRDGLSVQRSPKQSPAPGSPNQQKQLEDWQHTESGKMGKEEPSSQAETPKPPRTAAFTNGALTTAGAPTDVDTVPAKFSERNARDDQLILVAYTFKNLSDQERRDVVQAIKGEPGTTAFNGDVGTVVPFATELRLVPDALAGRVPQAKGFQYLNTGDRVLLISPLTRIVVGVFPTTN